MPVGGTWATELQIGRQLAEFGADALKVIDLHHDDRLFRHLIQNLCMNHNGAKGGTKAKTPTSAATIVVARRINVIEFSFILVGLITQA